MAKKRCAKLLSIIYYLEIMHTKLHSAEATLFILLATIAKITINKVKEGCEKYFLVDMLAKMHGAALTKIAI